MPKTKKICQAKYITVLGIIFIRTPARPKKLAIDQARSGWISFQKKKIFEDIFVFLNNLAQVDLANCKSLIIPMSKSDYVMPFFGSLQAI